LVVLSTSDAYDLSVPIQPDAQLAMYDGAVDQALADGYTGLRVAADITPLIADDSRRASHLHWEQFADRYIAERPLAPICMYDTRSISGIEPIACVHAFQGPKEPAFAVFAESASRVALAGEVDGIAAAHLEEILRCLPDGDERIDLTGVSFVDGRGAWTIRAAALRRKDEGRPIRLVGAQPAFRRVWELCGFELSLLEVA
jgi:anti-anti-sigma regulatory factor